MAQFNEFGQQIPDPTPLEVPLNLRRPLSIQDEIRRFVRIELSRKAEELGTESFEESDDFDIDDDEGDFASPYELTEMQEEAGFHDASDLRRKNEPVPGAAVVGRQDVRATQVGEVVGAESGGVGGASGDTRTLPLPGVAPAPQGGEKQ